MAPRGSQDGPRWPQDGPKMPQDGPKMPQDTHLSQKYVDMNKNTCFPDVFTHSLNQKLEGSTNPVRDEAMIRGTSYAWLCLAMLSFAWLCLAMLSHAKLCLGLAMLGYA